MKTIKCDQISHATQMFQEIKILAQFYNSIQIKLKLSASQKVQETQVLCLSLRIGKEKYVWSRL